MKQEGLFIELGRHNPMYKLISESNLEEFEIKLNEASAQGYTPHE